MPFYPITCITIVSLWALFFPSLFVFFFSLTDSEVEDGNKLVLARNNVFTLDVTVMNTGMDTSLSSVLNLLVPDQIILSDGSSTVSAANQGCCGRSFCFWRFMYREWVTIGFITLNGSYNIYTTLRHFKWTWLVSKYGCTATDKITKTFLLLSIKLMLVHSVS